MKPFGFNIHATLAQARDGRRKSNVVWHVPPLEEQIIFHRGRRGKVKIGQAFGYNTGRVLQPHGAREMARRLRQIQRGQLKAENGLVT